jgi:hypothetical protein
VNRGRCRTLVLFVALASGCARAAPDGEEWLAGGTDPFFGDNAGDVFLQPVDVRPVVRREAAALERLKNRPWAELEPEEAKRFGVDAPDGNGRLFLLRAVRAGGDRNGFRVRWREGVVRVQHFARVSEAPIPLWKCAVIVRLPNEPSGLETGLCIAE